LTIRFRVLPLGWASTYSRPVLGAEGNVDGKSSVRKGRSIRKNALFADKDPPRRA
jgi:hypothetical protein